MLIITTLFLMSNATPTQNGFLFQDCSAIVLLLDHIKDVKSLRVEGAKEDVELELNDGKYIYTQSKFCSKDRQKDNAIPIFQEALRSLSNADSDKCCGLVYATNIILPFGFKTPLEDFGLHDCSLDYSELSAESKKIVQSIIDTKKYSIDCSKLTIRIIAFHESDPWKPNNVIHQNISRFLSKLGNTFRFDDEEILRLLLDVIQHNKNKRNLNDTISKRDFVWILISYLMSTVDPNFNNLDPALKFEVETKYKQLISIHTERTSFTTKIVYDYNKWATGRPINIETVQNFIESNWDQYIDDFDCESIDNITQKTLITIVISKVLTLRYIIEDIKKVSGLVD